MSVTGKTWNREQEIIIIFICDYRSYFLAVNNVQNPNYQGVAPVCRLRTKNCTVDEKKSPNHVNNEQYVGPKKNYDPDRGCV